MCLGFCWERLAKNVGSGWTGRLIPETRTTPLTSQPDTQGTACGSLFLLGRVGKSELGGLGNQTWISGSGAGHSQKREPRPLQRNPTPNAPRVDLCFCRGGLEKISAEFGGAGRVIPRNAVQTLGRTTRNLRNHVCVLVFVGNTWRRMREVGERAG